MSNRDFDTISFTEWNEFRRRLHLLEARNEELREVHAMVKNNNSRMLLIKSAIQI